MPALRPKSLYGALDIALDDALNNALDDALDEALTRAWDGALNIVLAVQSSWDFAEQFQSK